MCDTALFLRYVQLHVKHNHPSNNAAYLHSLLILARQPRQLRSSNSNLLLVPVLRQMSDLELFQLLHDSTGNIATFRRKLKPAFENVLIFHSSPAYQSNCLQLELHIDYELLNPFCFGALPSLGLPRILAQ